MKSFIEFCFEFHKEIINHIKIFMKNDKMIHNSKNAIKMNC
jgi:hypothetical protein